MLRVEARLEIPVEHPGRHVGELPAARGARADASEDVSRIEAGGLRIAERLDRPREAPRYGYLVGHLGMLARAGPALEDRRSAHELEEGLYGLEIGLFTPDHDGQAAVPGADVSTGDRRVEGREALGLRGDRNAPREIGSGGRAVYEERARHRVLDEAFGAEVDAFDVGRITDHGENRATPGGETLGALVPVRARLDQCTRLVLGSRMDAEPVAGLEQVAGHARSHHSDADKAQDVFFRIHSSLLGQSRLFYSAIPARTTVAPSCDHNGRLPSPALQR